MFAEFRDWLAGQGKRFRSRRRDRTALVVELLEPRHLLTGDCLGFITGMGPAWQPDSQAEWCPAGLVSVESRVLGREAGQSADESDVRELIFLDELAEQLGEAIELDGFESWSYEGGWCDNDLF